MYKYTNNGKLVENFLVWFDPLSQYSDGDGFLVFKQSRKVKYF